MKVIDKPLLKTFAAKPRCELCHKPSPDKLEPHHWFYCRGMGGGSRLDVPANLAALCFSCHRAAHGGDAAAVKARLLAVVSRREGIDPEDLITALTRLKWSKKS